MNIQLFIFSIIGIISILWVFGFLLDWALKQPPYEKPLPPRMPTCSDYSELKRLDAQLKGGVNMMDLGIFNAKVKRIYEIKKQIKDFEDWDKKIRSDYMVFKL